MKPCPFNNSQLVSNDFCKSCILNKLSICAILKQQEVDLIKEHGNIILYKKGETIYKEGTQPNGLICLISSTVKIVKTIEDGSEEILSFHKPVDFLGVPEMITNSYYKSSAIALNDAVVNIIATEKVKDLFQHNPGFLYKISQYLSLQLLESQLRTERLTKKHMRGRLADTLLELHEMYKCDNKKNEIGIKLLRADLASYSNMTTANAIRTLSDFSKTGLIELQGRKIFIKDLSSLKIISHLS
jgi:CRP-like cAMP-binding protein